jgi:hypothetical protein
MTMFSMMLLPAGRSPTPRRPAFLFDAERSPDDRIELPGYRCFLQMMHPCNKRLHDLHAHAKFADICPERCRTCARPPFLYSSPKTTRNIVSNWGQNNSFKNNMINNYMKKCRQSTTLRQNINLKLLLSL